MEHPNCNLMLSYWNSVRNGAAVPDQSDIDPRAISRILSTVFILEACIPSQPTYRLAGAELCERYGLELRGRSFLDHWDEDSCESLAWLLTTGMKMQMPICFHSSCSCEGDHSVELETFLAPIGAGAQGPTRFIGVAQLLGQGRRSTDLKFAFQHLSNARVMCETEMASDPQPSCADLSFEHCSPTDGADQLLWLWTLANYSISNVHR